MSRSNARSAALVALLLVAALIGAWVTLPRPDTRPTGAPPSAPPAEIQRRARIPRPPPAPAPVASPAIPSSPEPWSPSPQPEPEPELDPEPTPAGPVDRREDPPPDADAVRELLMQQMGDMAEAVLPCVERWAEADPSLDGRLLLTLQLDQDGLQDAFVEDVDAVPEGLLDCFSDAVYAGDWSGISREPLEVTWPVVVTAAP